MRKCPYFGSVGEITLEPTVLSSTCKFYEMISEWDCGTATLVQLKVQFALLGIFLHAIHSHYTTTM